MHFTSGTVGRVSYFLSNDSVFTRFSFGFVINNYLFFVAVMASVQSGTSERTA